MSLDIIQYKDRSIQIDKYQNQIMQILNVDDQSINKWMNLLKRSFQLIVSETDKINIMRHFLNQPQEIKFNHEVIDFMIIQYLLESLSEYKDKNPDLLTKDQHFINIYLDFTKQYARLNKFKVIRKEFIFKSFINDLKQKFSSYYVYQQYLKEYYKIFNLFQSQQLSISNNDIQEFLEFIKKINLKFQDDITLYNLTMNDLEYMYIKHDLFKQIEQFKMVSSDYLQFLINEFIICDKFNQIKDIIQFIQQTPQPQQFYDQMFIRLNQDHIQQLKEDIIDESKELLKKLQFVGNIETDESWKHFALNFSYGSIAILSLELILKSSYIEKIIEYYTQRENNYNNKQIFDFLQNYFISNKELLQKKLLISPECALSTLKFYMLIMDDSHIFDPDQINSSLNDLTFYQIKFIQDMFTKRIPMILDLIYKAQFINKNIVTLRLTKQCKNTQQIVHELKEDIKNINDQRVIEAMDSITPKLMEYIEKDEIVQNENGVYDINSRCLELFFYDNYQEICLLNIMKFVGKEYEYVFRKNRHVSQKKKNKQNAKKVKKNK